MSALVLFTFTDSIVLQFTSSIQSVYVLTENEKKWNQMQKNNTFFVFNFTNRTQKQENDLNYPFSA